MPEKCLLLGDRFFGIAIFFWHSNIQAAHDIGAQQFHGFWPDWTSFGDD
tara:strand:- start:264 stop:410 length:147 start_codon:yes stop_codon:yes gene_type:complete